MGFLGAQIHISSCKHVADVEGKDRWREGFQIHHHEQLKGGEFYPYEFIIPRNKRLTGSFLKSSYFYFKISNCLESLQRCCQTGLFHQDFCNNLLANDWSGSFMYFYAVAIMQRFYPKVFIHGWMDGWYLLYFYLFCPPPPRLFPFFRFQMASSICPYSAGAAEGDKGPEKLSLQVKPLWLGSNLSSFHQHSGLSRR